MRDIVGRAMEIRKFNRFYTNITGLVNRTILESPYSLAEVRVMLEIDAAGSCSAAELTRLLKIDPGYLSRMLRRFKREKLVKVVKSPDDGRIQLLSLTDRGKAIFRDLSDASTRELVTMLDKLAPAEQEALVGHMTAVREILSGRAGPDVTIRTRRSGDAGYIAYRHGVLYEREYNLDMVFEYYVLSGLIKFLDSGADGEIWLAEAGGRVAGFIAIVGVDRETAQLRWFLIEPEFRGTGLGRRLMTAALDYCREKGFKRVFLWTFLGLDAARHLYENYGFIPTERAENNTWRDKLVEERWDLVLEE